MIIKIYYKTYIIESYGYRIGIGGRFIEYNDKIFDILYIIKKIFYYIIVLYRGITIELDEFGGYKYDIRIYIDYEIYD
jgi:hypothetical protein